MEITNYNEKIFEEIKHIDENGVEFWYARELMTVLDYKKWGNFKKVIDKAVTSIESTDITVTDHIADVSKMVDIGSDTKREIEDMKLTRYACYIIVQNGDSRKETIAAGQQYFAIQTRKQEILEKDIEELTENEKRLLARSSVTTENKKLFASAQNVGVKNFASFNNAGYQGLYDGETAADIKERKKLSKNQNILDHMDSTELAANLFRITQTDEVLKTGEIQGQNKANQTHFNIGKKVRETIIEISGKRLEELRTPEKSINEIKKEQKMLKKKK